MVAGFVWYGPLLGKQWMKLVGKTEKDMKNNTSAMPKLYGAMVVLAFVSTYVLGTLLMGLHVTSVIAGAQVGLLIGIGLVASAALTSYLFEGRPMKLFLINYGYHIVVLTINGALLTMWR